MTDFGGEICMADLCGGFFVWRICMADFGGRIMVGVSSRGELRG